MITLQYLTCNFQFIRTVLCIDIISTNKVETKIHILYYKQTKKIRNTKYYANNDNLRKNYVKNDRITFNFEKSKRNIFQCQQKLIYKKYCKYNKQIMMRHS